jgi:thioredoxin-related protein
MERVLLAVVLAAVVVAVALLLQRRRPDPPSSSGADHSAPPQLDRRDFVRPDAPWLVVVFTSATCSTCADVWAKAEVLASDEVAVQQVEAVQDRALHQRYQVGAVPIVVIADARGVVVDSFLGPVSATHLWAALAEAREPGSVPEGCGGGHDHDHEPDSGLESD